MYDLGAQSRQDLAQFTSDMGCGTSLGFRGGEGGPGLF